MKKWGQITEIMIVITLKVILWTIYLWGKRQRERDKFCMSLEMLSGLPVLRHSRDHLRSQCFCTDGVTELFWQLTLSRWEASECNRQTGRNILKVVVFQVSKMFHIMWVQQKSDLNFLLEKWTFADWVFFFFLDELWVHKPISTEPLVFPWWQNRVTFKLINSYSAT